MSSLSTQDEMKKNEKMKLFPGFGKICEESETEISVLNRSTLGDKQEFLEMRRRWHPFSFACPSSFKVIIVTQILVMLRIVQS